MVTLENRDLNYIKLQLLHKDVVIPIVNHIINANTFLSEIAINNTLSQKRRHAESLKKRQFLTDDQWAQIYPPDGAPVQSQNLDCEVQLVLLQHYGNLGEPINFKWNDLPQPCEIELYHDVARVRFYVKKLTSLADGLSDEGFDQIWHGLTEAIERMQNQMFTQEHEDITQKVMDIHKEPQKREHLERFLSMVEAKQLIGCSSEPYLLHLTEQIDKYLRENGEKQKVTVREFFAKMSLNIGWDWKKIGVNLGYTYQRVDHFLMNNPRDSKEAIIEMLCTWWKENKQNKTQEECLKEMKRVLESIEKTELAEMCDMFVIEEDSESGEACSTCNPGCLPDKGMVKDLSERLKNEYRCKYSEVSFVQVEDTQRFDVTSELYKPVQYMPIEVNCTRFSQQNIPATSSGKKRKLPIDSEFKRKKRKGGSVSQPVAEEIEEDAERRDENLENTQSTKEIANLLTTESNTMKYPILLEAEAGVGKTTLLHHLALKWAKGECEILKKFEFVFLIHLRRVKSNKIEEIICNDLKLLPDLKGKPLRNHLDLYKDKVLYLIDGLDEAKLDEKNELLKIMREPGSHVICTSRPVLQSEDKGSPHGMEKRVHVKLLGFSDDTIHSYIKTYFKNDHDGGETKADRILDECRKHMFCKAIMRTPLYTGLICFLWEKHNYNLPDTATQLFNRFLKEKLVVFWSKIDSKKPIDISFDRHPLEPKIPREIRRTLLLVAQLAFKTLVAGKVVFSIKDVDEYCLSLKEITQLGIFAIEDPDGSIIQFSHKLFHEYFAGLCLVRYPLEIKNLAQTAIREILLRTHALQHAFFFASGMSSDTHKETLKLIQKHAKNKKVSVLGKKEKLDIQIYLEVFKLQMVFEHGFFNDKTFNTEFETIPVHFSSAHSLAAAFSVVQSVYSDCKNMTLIGGGHIDTEQIRCIFDECLRADHITAVEIHNSTSAVMKELHRMSGSSITEISFHNCEVVVDVVFLCNIYPNIKVIDYDGDHKSVYKGNLRFSHCVMDERKVLIVDRYYDTDELPYFFNTIIVTCSIEDESTVDLLKECKVLAAIIETSKLKDIHPGLRQNIQTLVLRDEYVLVLSLKDIPLMFPNLKYVDVSHHWGEFKGPSPENMPCRKPVRLLVGYRATNFNTPNQHIGTQNGTLTVICRPDSMMNQRHSAADILKGMPLSVVTTLALITTLRCDPRKPKMVSVVTKGTDILLKQGSYSKTPQDECRVFTRDYENGQIMPIDGTQSQCKHLSSAVRPKHQSILQGVDSYSSLVMPSSSPHMGSFQNVPQGSENNQNEVVQMQGSYVRPQTYENGQIMPIDLSSAVRTKQQSLLQGVDSYSSLVMPSSSPHMGSFQNVPQGSENNQNEVVQMQGSYARPHTIPQIGSQRDVHGPITGRNTILHNTPTSMRPPPQTFSKFKSNYQNPFLLVPDHANSQGHETYHETSSHNVHSVFQRTGNSALGNFQNLVNDEYDEEEEEEEGYHDEKHISHYLKYYSCFPQMILGLFHVTSDLCENIELCMKQSPASKLSWKLEGQCIEKRLVYNAPIDDHFCTDTQWLTWEQFKVKCQELHSNYQLADRQGEKVDQLYGVIRMTRCET